MMAASQFEKFEDSVQIIPKRSSSHCSFSIERSFLLSVWKQSAPYSPASAHHSPSLIGTLEQLLRTKLSNEITSAFLKLLALARTLFFTCTPWQIFEFLFCSLEVFVLLIDQAVDELKFDEAR